MLEKMLQVSPQLAKSLGLEEALVLQLLLQAQSWQSEPWVTLSQAQKNDWLPFWSDMQFELILKRLQAQGLLVVQQRQPWVFQLQYNNSNHTLSEPQVDRSETAEKTVESEPLPVYTLHENEARRRNQEDDDLAYLKQTPTNRGIVRRTRMHEDWEPSEQLPHLLSFHNIPIEFALSELGKFRQYYLSSDKQEANWDIRLVTWVQREWHNSQQRKGRYEQQTFSEPTNHPREKRARVRDALRNIEDTDW